jgi:hypothetical protein
MPFERFLSAFNTRSCNSRNARSTKKRRRPSLAQRRLWLEALEDRILPATITWNNASGGSWSIPGNWDLNRLPAAGDDVVINLAGVTVTHSSGSDSVQSVTLSSTAALTLSGGRLSIAGNLQSTSNVKLSGGTLQGATVTAGTTLVGTTSGGTLDGVTLDGNITLTGSFGSPGYVAITNNLTLNGTATLTYAGGTAGGGVLRFDTTESLLGTGTVNFSNNNTTNAIWLPNAGTTLTISPGITVHGVTGDIGIDADLGLGGSANVSIVNQGTIKSDGGGTIKVEGTGWKNAAGGVMQASGGRLTFAGSWTNAGAISVASGSTLNLGGTFATTDLGTYTSAGTVNLTGTLNNAGNTLTLDDGAGNPNPVASWAIRGGTISGGTVAVANGATLSGTTAGGTLDGLTLDGNITLTGSFGSPGYVAVVNGLTLNGMATLTYAGGTAGGGVLRFDTTESLLGTGTVDFSNNSTTNAIWLPNAGTALTIGPGITVHGVTGDIGIDADLGLGGSANVSVVNQGTIKSDGGGVLTINGSGWQNTGTLTEASSTLDLAGTFTTSGLGSLTGNGGAINFQGTLTNNGTLTLAGAAVSPQYALAGGTITGGTVAATNGSQLTGLGGILDGVTLAAPLLVGQTLNNLVNVKDGLTLSQNTITMEGNGALNFLGSQTLGGAGSVNYADNLTNNGLKGLYVPNAGDKLTIAPGILIHGLTGFVGSAGGGSVANNGTIAADGGGTITVQGDTNYAAGTLTAGTWQVSGSSTLRLLGANISTNAANILLDGAGGHLYQDSGSGNALAAFAANAAAGGFTIQNGANFTAAGSFSNAGTITIGSGSTFAPGGAASNYTQSGGATYLAAGTLGATGAPINVNGGFLSGPGTVKGNLTNAGEVDVGSAPGLLTVSGTYTQTAAGVLGLKVGGTTAGSQFDQVNISGTAALGGTLNVSLINGFGPSVPSTFTVVTAQGSTTGNFSTTNLPLIDGQQAFNVQTTQGPPGGVSLVARINSPDLSVVTGTITANNVNPANTTGTPGQNITVGYTVKNLSPTAATGSWTDSVYLSTSGVLDINSLLLGRVSHTGGLAGFSSYTGSVTAPVPGEAPGSYFLIVVTDSTLQVPDISRANNAVASASALPVTIPQLSLGTPVTGTISNGQDLFYRVIVPPGGSVQVSAAFAASLEADLLVRFGAMPTPSIFEFSGGRRHEPAPRHRAAVRAGRGVLCSAARAGRGWRRADVQPAC